MIVHWCLVIVVSVWGFIGTAINLPAVNVTNLVSPDATNASSTNSSNLRIPATGGSFERKVNAGFDYLMMNGATIRARPRIILAHPSFDKARRAEDFIHLKISMVNHLKRKEYQTRNYPYTDGNWVAPVISAEDRRWWRDWNPEENYIDLEQAIRIANANGYVGPWEILSVYQPYNDPQYGWSAAEPFYGFHETQGGPYAVVGMESGRCFQHTATALPDIFDFPERPGVSGVPEVTS